MGMSGIVAAPAAADDSQGGHPHRIPPGRISIQLYQLRDQLAIDLEGTLAALAEIGYRRVEHSGFVGRTVAEFKDALDAAATCTSSWISSGSPGGPRPGGPAAPPGRADPAIPCQGHEPGRELRGSGPRTDRLPPNLPRPQVDEYIVERDDAGSPPRTPDQALETARVGYRFLRTVRFDATHDRARHRPPRLVRADIGTRSCYRLARCSRKAVHENVRMEMRRRHPGLVIGLFLLLALGGASRYAYGTTSDYTWFSYGVPSTLPPPRPLSLQVLRGLGAALAVVGLVAAAIATHKLLQLRTVSR